MISASIQCKVGKVLELMVMTTVVVQGYINVDAIDEDMPTLRSLEKKQLYRNYIWREVILILDVLIVFILIIIIIIIIITILTTQVSGIGSTGLREESYDVVMTAGGFSTEAISPNNITEVGSDINLSVIFFVTILTSSSVPDIHHLLRDHPHLLLRP